MVRDDKRKPATACLTRLRAASLEPLLLRVATSIRRYDNAQYPMEICLDSDIGHLPYNGATRQIPNTQSLDTRNGNPIPAEEDEPVSCCLLQYHKKAPASTTLATATAHFLPAYSCIPRPVF